MNSYWDSNSHTNVSGGYEVTNRATGATGRQLLVLKNKNKIRTSNFLYACFCLSCRG